MRVVVLVLLLSGCSALTGLASTAALDVVGTGEPLVDANVQVGATNSNTEAVVQKSDDKRIVTEDITGNVTINKQSSEALVRHVNDERTDVKSVTGGMTVQRTYNVPWWAMVIAVVCGVFIDPHNIKKLFTE